MTKKYHSQICALSVELYTQKSRAVDPDPYGSAFIFLPGSGFKRKKFEENNRKNARKFVEIVILFLKSK